MLYVPQGYHNGVALHPDDALHPDLWDDLLFGWDPAAQQGVTGKLYDFVRGVPRNFTALAAGDWQATEEGVLVPRYNGTIHGDSTGSTLNLSAVTQITVSFDLYWDAFANDDDLCWESSANFGSNAGGILADPNESASGLFTFAVRNNATNGNNYFQFARPAAAEWHNYTLTISLAAWAANGVAASAITNVWVDGVAQTSTKASDGNTAPASFGNYTWYFMSRAATSLQGAGRLGKFLIYRGLKRAEHAERFAQGETPFARRGRPAPQLVGLSVPAAPGGGNRRRRVIMGAAA